ncbi:hypothetical protein DMN91_004996 [Ooceraea biroi]|uniref:Peroxisomal membrane protein 11C n=1 Tax=Ooceraea biroi TaxID=2015173 RepID=A0A026WDW9_OOCBI|nr:peroxisomal membrane protein 11C [Ooceraea biroi]XP_011340210.1 peroxisomal membrane protein 11C [Ooceraea biroi]EZA53224.1 Peroxisomal membrane protein 11C [Ooceraea biroi]RLU22718.1 hypothetical protein DMN91_004996 [Ooceraea biroi]
MDFLSDYLETNSGRDKIFRLLSYTAKLTTVCTSSKDTERKLKTFGSQMSECRVMLRLLDDIPALQEIMSYGWGKQESDWLIRCCQLMQHAVGVVYAPIEHIAWAGQHKIVSITNDKWDLVTTIFWIISLQLSIVKSLRMLQGLQQRKTNLANNNSNKCMIEEINKKRLDVLLSCIRYTLDFVYAVHYLPPNVLWGGRFKTWQVGAFGTISSCIGLYQSFSSIQ